MINTAPILTRMKLPLAALALVVPSISAAQPVQDFQLPPNPTPTPTTPQVQGPVDIEAPLETAPRQIPTTRPTPTPQPSAAPARQPAQRPPAQAAPTVTPQTPRFTPARQQARLPGASNPATQTADEASNLTPPTDTGSPVTESSLPGFSSDFPSANPVDATESGIADGGLPWAWIAAFAALLAVLLGAVFFWRKRANEAVPAIIAPPLVKTDAGTPAATPPSANGSDTASALSPSNTQAPSTTQESALSPASAPSQWIKIEAHALELQRTMLNANLTYRLVIANRSGKALTDLNIEADLATAHGKLPVEDQLASPEKSLQLRETIERLAPGERLELRSNIMLPLSEVRIIQQGPKALLCVPLLRVRAVCEGRDPVARTWVVGQQNAETRGRVQPFRFDAPPQTYRNIGQRALD